MHDAGTLDSDSRGVLLVVAPLSEADAEEAERLARQLRTELDELEIESVTFLRSDEVPGASLEVEASRRAIAVYRRAESDDPAVSLG
jgi:hypothetical protein